MLGSDLGAPSPSAGPNPPSADERCAHLLCLLRLSEIVIADPGWDSALPAMVDELVRLEHVRHASVGLRDGGDRLSFLAHRGLAGHVAHRRFSETASAEMRRALAERRVVELPGLGRDGQVCVPILAGEQAIGVLSVHLGRGVPLDSWRHELFCAAADFMALAVLGRTQEAASPTTDGEPLRLTRRQLDALFELVEHGATNEQIGYALKLSARTVKIHLQGAYRALGVSTRGEAIRLILTQHPDWLARERERRRRCPTC